jgi:hypothetical protein
MLKASITRYAEHRRTRDPPEHETGQADRVAGRQIQGVRWLEQRRSQAVSAQCLRSTFRQMAPVS